MNSSPIRQTAKDIVRLAKLAPYSEQHKNRYKLAAMKYLRRLAESLGLEKDTYDIRWNAGGIAVSGDATLHHERFYLQITSTGCMFRTCKGRRDYTGGSNQWVISDFCCGSMTEGEMRERLASMAAAGIWEKRNTDGLSYQHDLREEWNAVERFGVNWDGECP